MKKLLLLFLCLFSLNTLTYASFPITDSSSSEVEIAQGVFDDNDTASEKLIQYISMLIFATGFYFLFRAWLRVWRDNIRWFKILTYGIFTFVLLVLLIPSRFFN